jgi:hypothetical protein
MGREQKTLTVDRFAWWVRYLEWVYDGPVKSMDFCLVFWGLVGSPSPALMRLVGLGAKNTLGRVTAVQRGAEHVASAVDEHEWAVVSLMLLLAGGALCVFVYDLVELAWWVPVGLLGLALLAAAFVILCSRTQLGRVLSTGYHAVKNRTCPLVEITDDESSAPVSRRRGD